MALECNNNYRSTYNQLKAFTDSMVWKDILQELQNWENRIMEELATPSFDANTGQLVMGKSERVLYDEMLRGSLKALDNMRMIPFIIMEILEQKTVTQNQENEHVERECESEFELD